jgi:hypothetical protein
MNATTEQSNLAHFLTESRLVCVEIGLAEIERAAQQDIYHIRASEITQITVAALHNRPQHVADILLVSSWMLAEAFCTDTQRDLVRQHYLTIARGVEAALS